MSENVAIWGLRIGRWLVVIWLAGALVRLLVAGAGLAHVSDDIEFLGQFLYRLVLVLLGVLAVEVLRMAINHIHVQKFGQRHPSLRRFTSM